MSGTGPGKGQGTGAGEGRRARRRRQLVKAGTGGPPPPGAPGTTPDDQDGPAEHEAPATPAEATGEATPATPAPGTKVVELGKPAKDPGAAPAGVLIDPRMRSRRIGVRRDAGRRRLKRATLVLAAIAAVVLAVAATRSPLLAVDRVQVSGNHQTRVADILRAAGIDEGRPMVSVDTHAAARRIERLPWVDRVTVGRAWPSTVEVRVTERTPVAAVRITDQQSAVVDADGRILAIDSAASAPATGAGVPVVITGVGGTLAEGGRLPAGARDALAIAVAVRQRLPGAVASVGTNLDLTLTDGGIVRFGSADQLQAKVTALQTVLDQVDTHCLRTLDVRVPGSPALTRNGGCS